MDCSVCGSQDTKMVTGISKKNNRPWKAYECNEPQCKNEKGYPTRTFVNTPKPRLNVPVPQNNGDLALVHKKLDAIMKHLNINLVVADPIRRQAADDNDSPF